MPRGLIPVLSGANFVIGMGAFLVIGVLTPLARDLEVSAAQAGWVMTVYALAYALLSPLLVAFSGGFGRRRVLAFGLTLFAVGALGSALAPSLDILLLARVVAAAGAGVTTPVIAAIVAGLAAPEMRGKALALVFMGLTVAQVLGVPAGSWLAYTYGWRVAFAGVAMLSALASLVIWVRVPTGLRFQPVTLRDLGQVLTHGPMMLAIFYTALFLGAIFVPFTYLAPMLEARLGLSRDGVTAALVVCGLGAVVGNLAGGWLSDRLGPFRTLLGLAVAQLVLMPILSLLPLPLVLAFGLFFLWNAFGYAYGAAQQSRLVLLAGPQAPVALALNAACIYVGAALGAALGGAVVHGAGLGALGLAGGVSILPSLAALWWSNRLSPVDRAVSGP